MQWFESTEHREVHVCRYHTGESPITLSARLVTRCYAVLMHLTMHVTVDTNLPSVMSPFVIGIRFLEGGRLQTT